MDVLSIDEMVKLEMDLFQSGKTTPGALMDAAAEAMAQVILANYPQARDFLVLVGKGNNGGDGLGVAGHLAAPGRCVKAVLAGPEDELGELPRARLARLREEHPEVEICAWRPDFPFPDSNGVAIDALLGVQARGELRGPLAEIVSALNAAREKLFFRTVALDLPTGLAACAEDKPSSGKHDGADKAKSVNRAVVADLTIAVGFAKDLLCREALAGWVGRIEVVPWSAGTFLDRPTQALVGHELAGLLPRRNALSHKNDFGRVVLVAGSPGFTGAAGLCSQAAQAMGAGLLCVITRSDAAAIVAAQAPHEAMVSGWSDTDPEIIKTATAIGIGPGLGHNDRTLAMLRAVLEVGCPVLVDADALTVLAKNLSLLRKAKGPVVLTPPPGRDGPADRAKIRAGRARGDRAQIYRGVRRRYADSQGHPHVGHGARSRDLL